MNVDTVKLKRGRRGRSTTSDRKLLAVQTDGHGGITTSKDSGELSPYVSEIAARRSVHQQRATSTARDGGEK